MLHLVAVAVAVAILAGCVFRHSAPRGDGRLSVGDVRKYDKLCSGWMPAQCRTVSCVVTAVSRVKQRSASSGTV